MEITDSILLTSVVLSYSISLAISFYYQINNGEPDNKDSFWFIVMAIPIFLVIWFVGSSLFFLIKLIINIIL